nr:alpha-galactosidase [Candidatus Sigynarchaeota archaeon]
MSSARIETDDRKTKFSNGIITVEINHMPLRYSIIDAKTSELIIKDAFFKFILDQELAPGKAARREILPDIFTYRYHEERDPFIADHTRKLGKSIWCFLDAPKYRLACWLAFDLEDAHARVLVRVIIVNQDTAPVKVRMLLPLAVGTLEGSGSIPFLDGTVSDLGVYCNGYQSWSTTRTFRLHEKNFYPPFRFAQNIWAYKITGFLSWLKRPRGEFLSNSVTVVTDIDSKRSMTVGFASCASQHGDIIVKATGKKEKHIVRLVARAWVDGKKVRPGGELPSEILYIQAKNHYPRCLDEYADIAARIMNPCFWDRVPFGYCTWYYYFHEITEAETMKNLQLITDKNTNPCFKVDYFQLDDGYQVTQGQCGDWKNVNKEKFPSGLKHLVGEIETKGLTPGLWIAPFNAMPGSDLARSHPDWLLRDKKVKPITGTLISMRLQHSLDPTNPAVKDYLKDLVRYFVHEVGFKYIKIDFIYSAITDDAVFFDQDVTRVEAFRNALSILREAAGDDVFILGCGAPLMESVGFVNGMRIGTDT